LQTDEKEATELVLKKAFDGTIDINDDEIFSELLSNSSLIDDIS
jgi:hypothetical protein